MNAILAAMDWHGVGIRTGVVIAGLAIWFWSQRLIGRKALAKDGIGDAVHEWTAKWHRYLVEHRAAANATLITSSIFIDIIGISLIVAGIFGSTFAPFLAVLIVFALRQVCQGLCTLPPPPGIIWRNPGFPALLVTYDVGNDFFFSGHTALAVLGAIEAAHLGPPWLAVVAACIALAEMVVVLVLRAHYTLDVIAGILAAVCAADLAHRWAPALDTFLR